MPSQFSVSGLSVSGTPSTQIAVPGGGLMLGSLGCCCGEQLCDCPGCQIPEMDLTVDATGPVSFSVPLKYPGTCFGTWNGQIFYPLPPAGGFEIFASMICGAFISGGITVPFVGFRACFPVPSLGGLLVCDSNWFSGPFSPRNLTITSHTCGSGFDIVLKTTLGNSIFGFGNNITYHIHL